LAGEIQDIEQRRGFVAAAETGVRQLPEEA
jgi:hypothetical protein